MDANLTKLSELARQCRFVPVDEPIVAEYGRVKTRRGRGALTAAYGLPPRVSAALARELAFDSACANSAPPRRSPPKLVLVQAALAVAE